MKKSLILILILASTFGLILCSTYFFVSYASFTNDTKNFDAEVENKKLSKNDACYRYCIKCKEVIWIPELCDFCRQEQKEFEEWKKNKIIVEKNDAEIKILKVDTTGYLKWDFKFLNNLEKLPEYLYHKEGKDFYLIPRYKIQELLIK